MAGLIMIAFDASLVLQHACKKVMLLIAINIMKNEERALKKSYCDLVSLFLIIFCVFGEIISPNYGIH